MLVLLQEDLITGHLGPVLECPAIQKPDVFMILFLNVSSIRMFDFWISTVALKVSGIDKNSTRQVIFKIPLEMLIFLFNTSLWDLIHGPLERQARAQTFMICRSPTDTRQVSSSKCNF